MDELRPQPRHRRLAGYGVCRTPRIGVHPPEPGGSQPLRLGYEDGGTDRAPGPRLGVAFAPCRADCAADPPTGTQPTPTPAMHWALPTQTATTPAGRLSAPMTHPVLYAEDEQDDVFFLQLAWKEAGVPHPLMVVTDGQQVIDYLAGRGTYANRTSFPLPRLLLLDLKLPIHSGFDVLEWVRLQPNVAALNVVVISGSELEQDRERARNLGVIDYVVKPPSPARLIHIVRERYQTWLQG